MKSSNLTILALFFLIALALSGCGNGPLALFATPTPTATATPTDTPTTTPTPTVTPTLTPTSTPTPTPTPTPLSAADVFALVSPAVVFIDTPAGQGSGVLVEDGYVVTNAHVVWPFEEVRVVFPDGSEHLNAPVLNWDLMGDLAVIGPFETSISPVELVNGEGLITGSDVFLIGYPHEAEKFPQPTFTRGLISRVREWEPIKMTYFQTDASVAGGQSGGVLVSEEGKVVGISSYALTEARFGVIASAADVLPRLEHLIAGEDIAELGERRVPLANGELEYDVTLHNKWEVRPYIINEPSGTFVDIEVEGKNDAGFVLLDPPGNVLIYANENESGLETGSVTTVSAGPHFVIVAQVQEKQGDFQVRSNRRLIPVDDPDDGTRITIGQTLRASMDYPGDSDYFLIDLEADEIINVTVDSIVIDPILKIDYPDAQEEQVIVDDNSGGGPFGISAELTYRAPHSDTFSLVVRDAGRNHIGGYLLTVAPPPPGATPVAPPPTPTPTPTPRPTPTPTITYIRHEDDKFSFVYPQHWSISAEPDVALVGGSADNEPTVLVAALQMPVPLPFETLVRIAEVKLGEEAEDITLQSKEEITIGDLKAVKQVFKTPDGFIVVMIITARGNNLVTMQLGVSETDYESQKATMDEIIDSLIVK